MKLTDEQRWSEIAQPLYVKPRKIHSSFTLECSQDLTAIKRYCFRTNDGRIFEV